MKKLHALVVAFPAQGHIGPFMDLCISLATTGGFRITFANYPESHAAIRHLEPLLLHLHSRHHPGTGSADIHLIEIPPDPSLSARTHQPSSGVSGPADQSPGQRHLLLAQTCQDLRDIRLQRPLVEIVRSLLRSDPPITCILSDIYAPFTLALAQSFGLPRIVFCPQSAGTLASYMSIFRRDPRPSPGDVIDYIPGVTTLKWNEITTTLQSGDPNNPKFQYLFECFHTLEDSPYILMNTFQELENVSLSSLEESLKKKLFSIGPMLPLWYFDNSGKHNVHETNKRMGASLWKEDYSCLQWLDEQTDKSVLYVSFGSITILTYEQFVELALGLEMSLKPILWVIRPNLMIEEMPVAFPDGYLERMHGRSCFVSWAPQKQVLIHRSIGGFFTHCGWNSTLESISAGVPILGWPYFADQMLNCRQCVDRWGIGLKIETDELGFVTKQEVCKKVKMLMQPWELLVRDNSQKWKKSAHQAIGEGGSSHSHWKEFLQIFSQFASKDSQLPP